MGLDSLNVLVGVTGGIAAYKAVEVVSRLRRLGARTRVVMTRNATRFVSPLTFRTISRNRVHCDMFAEPLEWNVEHVSLAEWANVFLVVPATADSIAKMACGIADDMLTTVCLACTCPKVVAPAMDSGMWENPAVQRNVAYLKECGFRFIEPEEGPLASGSVGKGRLASPERIVEFVASVAAQASNAEVSPLKEKTVVVTAGPTREPIDPVRFITNGSTGKMGYAIAAQALSRGATVALVTGPTSIAPPTGAEVVPVRTAEEMRVAVLERLDRADVIIKAAAVGDFRVESPSPGKIKKEGRDGLTLRLSRTPDILAELGRMKGSKILVGFAAETADLVQNARRKLAAKNLDMMVANEIGAEDSGFESDTNKVLILHKDGGTEDIPLLPKAEVANVILDRIEALLRSR